MRWSGANRFVPCRRLGLCPTPGESGILRNVFSRMGELVIADFKHKARGGRARSASGHASKQCLEHKLRAVHQRVGREGRPYCCHRERKCMSVWSVYLSPATPRRGQLIRQYARTRGKLCSALESLGGLEYFLSRVTPHVGAAAMTCCCFLRLGRS
ncbi:unnamed protein product [Scytosiphon promiscuus]